MEQRTNSADDISFSALIQSILRSLILLQSMTAGFFKFTKRHKTIIIVCTFIFTLIGVGLSFLNKKVYKLRMTVVPTELNRKIYANQFLQLDKLIKTKSYNQLTKQLNFDPNLCKKLKGISCFDIYNEPMLKDSLIDERNPFIVELSVFDFSIADTMQQALVNYINNNEYLADRKKVQEQILTDRLLFVENEQRKLDSLKSVYSNFMNVSGKNAMFYNNAFNPSELYTKSKEYQDQKDEVISWFGYEKKPLRVIDGFKPAQRADSISGFMLVVFSIFLGFFMGILFAGYRELEKLGKQLNA
ncbi:MAG: Wzz/FepE/Etk N-terminal domain-containing protein [Chitinophagaceae bacterium]